MPTYTLVRPRKRTRSRRRNSITLARGKRTPRGQIWQTRRGKTSPPGAFLGTGGTSRLANKRRRRSRRRRNSGLSTLFKRKRRRNRARRNAPVRHRRRRNRARARVSHRRRPNRRRRNTGMRLHRRRRNRSHGRRHNRRRRNTGLRLHRRRRNRSFHRRRNFGGGVMGFFREVFSVDTGVQVLAGTVGLSASLWGPKLAGNLISPRLGRGWGGVATSLVSVGLVSGLTGYVSPRAGRAAMAGGLLGVFAGIVSAISCSFRQTVLPFETGLLACALPNNPAAPLTAGQVNQARAAMAMTQPTGVNDFVTRGMRDYGGPGNSAGVQALINAQSAGMKDYAQYAPSSAASSAGMDSSQEVF